MNKKSTNNVVNNVELIWYSTKDITYDKVYITSWHTIISNTFNYTVSPIATYHAIDQWQRKI